VTAPCAEVERNALLDLHFEEGDVPAATRAHVAACAPCREYLGMLATVDDALRAWSDEPLPAGLVEGVLRRVPAPERRAPAPAPATNALALLGVLPVMAMLVAAIRVLAGRLAAQPFWPELASFPAAELALSFGAAALVTFGLGALATFALAPALVMDAGRPRGLGARPAGSRA
jgi:hypothetical protein